MMNGQGFYEYPIPKVDEPLVFGLYPIDFLLESIIRGGIDWFRTDPRAPNLVFGHLNHSVLQGKYGQAKIDEIAAFINKYEIKVVQHFSMIDKAVPSISIQLLDGNEMTERAGLNDFQDYVDAKNNAGEVTGRSDAGYIPISDSVHIGIHASATPDLTKYLYYLVIYILSAFKAEMEQRGMMLGTFHATDISRLNEYIPENIYSRFINFSVFSIASFDKGIAPIVEHILGLSVKPGHDPAVEDAANAEAINTVTGIVLEDTKMTSGGK